MNNEKNVTYIHVKNHQAIYFADWILSNYEMGTFELLHPKRKNVDDDLCWVLAGTNQKYTTEELFEIFEKEQMNNTTFTHT